MSPVIRGDLCRCAPDPESERREAKEHARQDVCCGRGGGRSDRHDDGVRQRQQPTSSGASERCDAGGVRSEADCGGKKALKSSGSTAQPNAMTRFVAAYEQPARVTRWTTPPAVPAPASTTSSAARPTSVVRTRR